MDKGRNVLTLGADLARQRYQRIRARFEQEPPKLEFKGALQARQTGRELEIIANGEAAQIMQQLQGLNPEFLNQEALTLEEIFVATSR